ncbi:MAG: PRC-barrel domain-containing protein, partial [Actinomycetota bacterium]|nr:PRC-barrel domain-containing protein [Actinomycetota bacterium]
MPAPDNAIEWRGRNMVDRDGDKIGTIEEIFLDAETDNPEWALVQTGLFGTRLTFVPLEGASLEGEAVRVSHEKTLVKDAPAVEREGELSQEEEERLYSHYGLDASRRGSAQEAEAEGAARAEPEGEEAQGEEPVEEPEARPTAGEAPEDEDGQGGGPDFDAARADYGQQGVPGEPTPGPAGTTVAGLGQPG